MLKGSLDVDAVLGGTVKDPGRPDVDEKTDRPDSPPSTSGTSHKRW